MPAPRITRREQFQISLDIKQDRFISPSDPSQKNWVIARAMEELAEDLENLDAVSRRFVPGGKRQEIAEEWAKAQAKYGDSDLVIDGQQVMQECERPYMEAMARVVTETHGDVLEVGFGRTFTYYSNEIDSVSRCLQRALFKYSRSATFSVCHPLFPPKDCNYWWADSMVVVKAVK